MSKIDIRTIEDDVINAIIFGEKPDEDADRIDTAYEVNVHDGHPRYIFIEASGSEYISVRKGDVGNLIKALEKAKEIWEGVK